MLKFIIGNFRWIAGGFLLTYDIGEEIHANVVVSAMDVKRTFLTCMDKSDLPEKFHKRVENLKIRG